jgi:23S rRNA pseudouridine955/2504/2580 synthase
MSGVQTLTVGPGEGDQRLDRWFRRHFPQISQGRIEKMCRKGEIRVDGGRVKPATRIEVGQSIRVPPLPDTEAPPRPPKPSVSDADAAMIRACVLYRDAHLIALNKPPGLAVQGGSGTDRHLDGMTEALMFGNDERPRLVHRLDRDTSGVLLLGRTREAAAALTAAFRARDTRKIYWAAVAGVPKPRMGTIRFGLVKAPGHGKGGEGEKMRCIHPKDIETTEGAKRATTDYAVLSALGGRLSWAALVPVTGRTHQLRAHMAEIGHPVIGDGKYGGSGQENQGDGWGAMLGGELSKKLHLHARSLSLEHPMTGTRLTFTAPLPEHMARTWDTLGWDPRDVPEDPFEDEDD